MAMATIASTLASAAAENTFLLGGGATREEIRNDPIYQHCKNECRFTSKGYTHCLNKCIKKKKQ